MKWATEQPVISAFLQFVDTLSYCGLITILNWKPAAAASRAAAVKRPGPNLRTAVVHSASTEQIDTTFKKVWLYLSQLSQMEQVRLNLCAHLPTV